MRGLAIWHIYKDLTKEENNDYDGEHTIHSKRVESANYALIHDVRVLVSFWMVIFKSSNNSYRLPYSVMCFPSQGKQSTPNKTSLTAILSHAHFCFRICYRITYRVSGCSTLHLYRIYNSCVLPHIAIQSLQYHDNIIQISTVLYARTGTIGRPMQSNNARISCFTAFNALHC